MEIVPKASICLIAEELGWMIEGAVERLKKIYYSPNFGLPEYIRASEWEDYCSLNRMHRLITGKDMPLACEYMQMFARLDINEFVFINSDDFRVRKEEWNERR